MYQLSACHVLQVSDLLLCPSILKVGINTREVNRLTKGISICFPCMFCESAIVCQIVMDLYTMTLSKPLK